MYLSLTLMCMAIPPYEHEVEKLLETIKAEDELIVFSDLMGGSITNPGASVHDDEAKRSYRVGNESSPPHRPDHDRR